MPTRDKTNIEVAKDGISAVVTELGKRNITLAQSNGNHLEFAYLGIPDRLTVHVKVKRNLGNWHTDIKEGSPPSRAKENAVWIFVNLNDYKSPPSFWVVPDGWIRMDIHTKHKAYLERYQGHRKKNDKSTHHSISEARIAEWRNKVDFISR